MEDLTEASKKASGDVRAGIESAMSRLRDASSTARREQSGPYRERFRSATANLLEGVEKEARKRREHLQGGREAQQRREAQRPEAEWRGTRPRECRTEVLRLELSARQGPDELGRARR